MVGGLRPYREPMSLRRSPVLLAVAVLAVLLVAAALLSPAASSWRRWTRDPAVIERVRSDLAGAIEEAARSGCVPAEPAERS